MDKYLIESSLLLIPVLIIAETLAVNKKMKMKRLLILIFAITLISCESEEQKIKKAENTVKSFVSNLQFDNYDKLFSFYPNFKRIETYWKLNSIIITSSNINPDESITIIGSSNNRQVLFELQRQNNQYLITNSKGLSSDYNSNIYKFCKKIGCIGASEYDADISNICKENKYKFEKLVNDLKTRIESRTVLENHTLTKSYGTLSGDITIKNYSRFTIPGHVYKIYVKYLNSKDEVIFTSNQSLSNFQSIPYNQSKTIHIFENNVKGFRKVDIQLSLTTSNFIEKIIAENVEGSNCKYSNNL